MENKTQWKQLTKSEKAKYKEIADRNYGQTNVKSLDEPLYFDERQRLISPITIISLLFNSTSN